MHNPTERDTVVDFKRPGCSQCPDLAELTRAVQALTNAFPGGDADGHRRYHEEVIAAMKARKDFWTKLTFELFKWGIIGFAGWGILQLWYALLKGPK